MSLKSRIIFVLFSVMSPWPRTVFDTQWTFTKGPLLKNY